MPDKCKQEVWARGQWHGSRCSRDTVQDGYCKQHHPDAVAKRDAEREKKYAETRVEYHRQVAARKQSEKDAALGAFVRELLSKDDDGLFMTRTYIRMIDAIRERIAQEQP